MTEVFLPSLKEPAERVTPNLLYSYQETASEGTEVLYPRSDVHPVSQNSSILKIMTTCILFLILGLIPLFTSCSGGGTDIGNPEGMVTIEGSLFYQDGSPAGAITVAIRKSNYVPDSLLITLPKRTKNYGDAVTDSTGYFRIDSIIPAPYFLEAWDRDTLGMVLELEPDGSQSKVTLPPDTLRATGRITGTVTAANAPANTKITIVILGLDRMTASNSNGIYNLSAVPAGIYSLYYVAYDDTHKPFTLQDVILFPGEIKQLDPVVLEQR